MRRGEHGLDCRSMLGIRRGCCAGNMQIRFLRRFDQAASSNVAVDMCINNTADSRKIVIDLIHHGVRGAETSSVERRSRISIRRRDWSLAVAVPSAARSIGTINWAPESGKTVTPFIRESVRSTRTTATARAMANPALSVDRRNSTAVSYTHLDVYKRQK